MRLFIFFTIFVLSRGNCYASANLDKTSIANDLYNFAKYNTFAEYVNNYRTYIKKFRPDITQEEVERLAPLLHGKFNKSCKDKNGFVLIHGLSDSPFYMSDIANSIISKSNKDCLMINIPVLPGNALMPGASLEATYKDWISAVDLAVNDLKKQGATSITLVGFSTGGALALNQALTHADLISHVTLIAPALDIGLPWYASFGVEVLTWLGNIKSSWGYVTIKSDINPYKYDSFSAKGISELKKLIEENNNLLLKFDKINTSIFLDISLDDITINSDKALEILSSDKFTNFNSGVVYTDKQIDLKPNIKAFLVQNLEDRVVNLSHIGIAISPDNPIFGKNAKINYGCNHYDGKFDELFEECKKFGNDFYYGELTKENLKKYPKLSRITYNPGYHQLLIK